jgi:hypothetical protein
MVTGGMTTLETSIFNGLRLHEVNTAKNSPIRTIQTCLPNRQELLPLELFTLLLIHLPYKDKQ